MKKFKELIFNLIIVLSLLFVLLTATTGCGNIPIRQDTGAETSNVQAIKETTIDESNINDPSTIDWTGAEENPVSSTEGSQKYAVVASGISIDNQHYGWFLNSTRMAYSLLKNNGYTDENIYYLFENSKEPNVDYEATIDNFKKVIGDLNGKSTVADRILLILIGHGTCIGENSYYCLNDYNLSDVEMAEMFKSINRQELVFVFSPCNSGGFIDNLSDKNNIVITSTQKNETNRAAFIEPFLDSFNGSGDSNSDGKVSFAEAFNYAGTSVINQYVDNNWGIMTEHAQLDDNGDKMGHEAPIPDGGDGQASGEIFLK